MPDSLVVRAPERSAERQTESVVRVRAELVSVGGGILLTICLLLTAGSIAALLYPGVTSVQRFIAGVLLLAAWVYFIRSITEELALVDRQITFRAILARTRTIRIDELASMELTHQGVNLERGIETIEFQTFDKRIERVSLGPCWDRDQLEAFVRSVEEALHES
jgi:hypothetical protein